MHVSQSMILNSVHAQEKASIQYYKQDNFVIVKICDIAFAHLLVSVLT